MVHEIFSFNVTYIFDVYMYNKYNDTCEYDQILIIIINYERQKFSKLSCVNTRHTTHGTRAHCSTQCRYFLVHLPPVVTMAPLLEKCAISVSATRPDRNVFQRLIARKLCVLAKKNFSSKIFIDV